MAFSSASKEDSRKPQEHVWEEEKTNGGSRLAQWYVALSAKMLETDPVVERIVLVRIVLYLRNKGISFLFGRRVRRGRVN